MNDDIRRWTTTHDDRQRTKNSGWQRHSETSRETQSYTAAKHNTVVKNQHWAEKWADAEKRTVDFCGLQMKTAQATHTET